MPKLSPENLAKIQEMQAKAWKRVGAQASVVQLSSPGQNREWQIKFLLDMFDEEKRKIDRAIDRMPDV